jgi:uncharacterized protein (DUF697 family)/GTPase SAR1 family protein
MSEPTINVQETVNEAIEKALKSRGIANVLIAGKTGVGKSTLVNAVFQGRMAETGQGRPVTQHTRRISKEGVPVSIYDTKGLEIKDYKPILEELLGFIKKQNSQQDPQAHIHVAWLCIAEGSRRVEDAELSLVKQLATHIPVIVVITTAVADAGFKKTVQELMPEARNVVRINSLPQPLDGGLTIPQHGLQDLVEITMEVMPDGQKNAFAAAQRVALQQKVNQAHKVVAAAATAAATAAAVPVPFSDALAIVPVQISMLAGISACFGLDVSKGFLGTVVSGSFSSLAGTLGGRAAVGALLKFFPGIGSVAGGVVSATVATTLTVAFGEAYIATLQGLLKENPDRQLSGQEVAEAFKKRMDA